MTFGQVLDLLKTHGGYIRLPYWNENTKVHIRILYEFTNSCLIIESDKGQIAWIPNMIELLENNWEWYEYKQNTYKIEDHFKYLIEEVKNIKKVSIHDSYIGHKVIKIHDENTNLQMIAITPYSFIFIGKNGEDEVMKVQDEIYYNEILKYLKIILGENNEKHII